MNGAVVSLGIALPLGVIAYAPLGAGALPLGIRAALVSAIFGNAVASLVGGSRLASSGPRASVTLVFAAFIASLMANAPQGAPVAGEMTRIAFLASSCLVVAGLLQALFGILRVGALVKFVPYPVVAGFMNGIAILILLSQLPPLLGIATTTWISGPLAALRSAEPWTLVVGVTTAAAIWMLMKRWPRAPSFLLGLVLGTALYFAIRHTIAGAQLGSLVGSIPPGLPSANSLLHPDGGRPLLPQLPALLGTASIIAIIGSLDSLLAAISVDAVTNERHDSNRVLIGQGLANVAVGAIGGIPVAFTAAAALAIMRGGGSSRAAALASSSLLLVVLLVGGPVLGLVPLAALAGVMIIVAIGLADRWTRVLVRQLGTGHGELEAHRSVAVVALVCVITLWLGFLVAVAAGVLLSMVLFIASMNRSLVRSRASGRTRSSRRVYLPEPTRLLREQGDCVQVLELEGALFFGTAEKLSMEVEDLARKANFIVLDLRRVTTIDASGAVILERLSSRLGKKGVLLLLASVGETERHGRALLACGTFLREPRTHWFPNVDRALEFAERELLARARIAPSGIEMLVQDLPLMQGLDDAQKQELAQHFERLSLPRDTVLFRAGEPGDRMFTLAQGSVSILQYTEGATVRLVSFAPGVTFGEAAMLDGGGRTADGVADEDAVVYVLTRQRLEALKGSHPDLASQVLFNLARQVSLHLRFASEAMREMDR